jgi:tetratricopeptide (TPR) repeat protein
LALNKRKVLDAARKYAQKGAKARALKEYNKLLQADPRDAKLLLEVGDAYRRWGQATEAISQYSKVAQQYRQEGFDARAVAVFKQILNLDPKHYAAHVALAELYQRMGLDSEAISALQTAADGYHKEGRKSEALQLLRQMAALDPSNTTSRLKVAELLRQEGMDADALAEYQAVAAELEGQGARDQLITVQERILELKPDERTTLNALVRNLMSDGSFERAEALALQASQHASEPAQYELLIDLYAQMGQDSKLTDATRSLARLYRERGDDEKARELMQRLPAEEIVSDSALSADASDFDEPLLGDDELLDDDPFEAFGGSIDSDFAAGSDPMDSPGPGASRSRREDEAKPPDPAPPPPIPQGDPDQLLAEASVYLRYGKRVQAIASLKGVLAQVPDHRAALEKLGEAYADEGQSAEAVEVWCRAAEQLREAGEAEALSVLRDRIASLDPEAASRLGSVETSAGDRAGEAVASLDLPEKGIDQAGTEPVDLDLDVEVELDLDEAIEEVAGESPSGLDFGLPGDARDDEFELDLDEESERLGSSSPAEAPAHLKAPTEGEAPLRFENDAEDEMFELELDSAEVGAAPKVEAAAESPRAAAAEASNDFAPELELDASEGPFQETARAPESVPSAGPSLAMSRSLASRVGEELEEAEFYLTQKMYAEAEGVLKRILEVSPNHPGAMARLGELRAAQGSSPDEDVRKAEGQSASTLPIEAFEPDFEERTARLEDDTEADDPTEENLLGTSDDAEIAFEVDLDDDLSEDGATSPPEVASDELEAPIATAASVDSRGAPEAAASDSGETFDLREALADVIAQEEAPRGAGSSTGVLSTVEDGFGSIFSDFKKGVSETLEEGDFDTRYDLGIAYREMGLFDDAIAEFRFCLDCEARRFDSLYLMGLCARDLSRFDHAVNYLEQALALPEIPTERQAGVYFDLSIAQEGIGDASRARASVQRVIEIDPDFPGAAERLAALDRGEPPTPELGEPGDGFESFDDLFEGEGDEDGDQAIVEAAPAQAYESFDDLLSDAEAELDEAALAEGAVEDAPLEEMDPSPATGTPNPSDSQSRRKSGRKKISFV